MSKTLIAYYSQSGSTKKLVGQIARETNGDILEITVPAGTFPDNMFQTADVAKKQHADGDFPKLSSKLPDLSGYENLVVAGPNWSAEVATPVISFLKEIQDFPSKVISVNTSVGQNDDQYNTDFKKQAGKLDVIATINNDIDQVMDLLK